MEDKFTVFMIGQWPASNYKLPLNKINYWNLKYCDIQGTSTLSMNEASEFETIISKNILNQL